eukprot:TRINITY_DN3525_c0_g1_i3.p1 TRINITY_DN3525_c0_g1~~TRINITY_DN3525_c0_g1_i3.p1  ORF type:complete len:138 (-),score=19.25 TRINITY_DN3525_c0_g1_i3:129-542(-)
MCFGKIFFNKKTRFVSRAGSFDDICTDMELFKTFEAYLLKEHAEENLHFYRDIVRFSNQDFPSPKSFVAAVREICDNYLGTGDKEMILYLSPAKVKDILKTIKEPSRNIFYQAKVDIEMILKSKFIEFEIAATSLRG